jgi:hypothetical protein
MGTGACIKRRLRELMPKDAIKPERAKLFLPRGGRGYLGPILIGAPIVRTFESSPWPTPAYKAKRERKSHADV